MLSFNEISNRINTPSLIKTEDLEDLRQLSEKYPFSAIFSQLYLKGLTLHDNISFDTELKLHAYKIPDRAQLFHLVHHAESPQFSTEEVRALDTTQETSMTEQEEQEVAAEEPVIRDEEEVDVTESDHGQEEETESKPPHSTSTLDRDIIAHAVSSSIFLEVDEDEEEYSFAQLKRLDESNTDVDKPTEVEFDLSHDDEQDTIEENGTETKEEEFKTFTSWVSEYIEKNQSAEHLEIEKKPSKEENFEEIFGLEKREKEFFSPTKKAKESLDESRLPVSETLAKIYIAQGNYPKAIYSYEKLMLKFPEKKSFFAIQIQTLKKKLN